MLGTDFSRRRMVCSFFASLILSAILVLPLFFIPHFGWYRLVPYILLVVYLKSYISPVVSRLLVDDQRYDPSFRIGTYVKIARHPYDFEMEELMSNRFGYYELTADEVGKIVETDGIFVWIETEFAYLPAHVNCLELMPVNCLKANFEAYSEPYAVSLSDE